MRILNFAAIAIVMMFAAPPFAQAQTPQVSPTRVEFTRPGGTPGKARAVVRASDVYMLAPAQPGATVTTPPRKKR